MLAVGVTRWRRYGKDRLYVKGDDGDDLGWWDLQDNTSHPVTPQTLSLLLDAVTAWRSAAADPQSAEADPESAADPEPATPEPGLPTPEPVPPPEPEAFPRGPDFLPPEWRLEAPEPVDASIVTQAPPVQVFAPPQGPPVVADLAYNRPGEQLADKVTAAREAGERPTLWRRFWLGKNAYSTWERGAIGERLVAEQLSGLVQQDPRWHFINSIPVGEEVDIDVFVVGPGGAFTINAKYHRGARIWVGGETLMVNGTRQPYVRNSRHEAHKASRLLTRATGQSVTAQGIVVPVDAGAFIVKAQPGDVHVINRVRLPAYLRSRPETLEPERVERIFNAARLSITWRPTA